MSFSSTSYADKSGGLWISLNRLLLALIGVTLVTSLGYNYLPDVSNITTQELRRDALKAEIENQKMHLARNLHEEVLLKMDSEFIGIKARDQLDVMRENETVFRVEPARPEISKMKRNSQ